MNNIKENGFYVAKDECVSCACCEGIAPKLFSHNKTSFIKKQPDTPHELRTMFRASRVCMVDCIYYAGKDELLKEYFTNVTNCYERNGNVCSLENCPCFDAYLLARSKFGNA